MSVLRPTVFPPAATSPSGGLSAFQVAVIGSVLLHAFLVFGVIIRPPHPARLPPLSPQLEVVLVNAKSSTRPTHADFLAQNNLDGGGNVDDDRRAGTPLPVMNSERTNLELQEKRVKQLEQESRRLMTQAKAAASVDSRETQRQTDEAKPLPDAADLMNRSLEIARLEARISKNLDDYQKRPHRKFIGSRAQEYRFARYEQDWSSKIERIGTLNYPIEAAEKGIHGDLVLTASIRSDGSVEKVEINRSSGFKILDEAAVRIVQLGAPYAPFPTDIARDTDIIAITKTWSFTQDDQLSTH